MHPTWEQLVSALQALVDAGVPTDVQEWLMYGNPDLGVKPKALERAVAAAFTAGWNAAMGGAHVTTGFVNNYR